MFLVNLFHYISNFLRSIFFKKTQKQYFSLSSLPDGLVLSVAEKINFTSFMDVYCCNKSLNSLLEVRRITPYTSITCDVVTISSGLEKICIVCIDPKFSIYTSADFLEKAQLQIVQDPSMIIIRLPSEQPNRELLKLLGRLHIACGFLHVSKSNSDPCLSDVVGYIQFREIHRADYITPDFHYVMSQMLLPNLENK